MNVAFWESDKNIDKYSPKAVSVEVNFSEMGICRFELQGLLKSLLVCSYFYHQEYCNQATGLDINKWFSLDVYLQTAEI